MFVNSNKLYCLFVLTNIIVPTKNIVQIILYQQIILLFVPTNNIVYLLQAFGKVEGGPELALEFLGETLRCKKADIVDFQRKNRETNRSLEQFKKDFSENQSKDYQPGRKK